MEGSPTLSGPFASELILSVLTLLEAAVPGHQGSDSLELSMPGTALAALQRCSLPSNSPPRTQAAKQGQHRSATSVLILSVSALVQLSSCQSAQKMLCHVLQPLFVFHRRLECSHQPAGPGSTHLQRARFGLPETASPQMKGHSCSHYSKENFALVLPSLKWE